MKAKIEDSLRDIICNLYSKNIYNFVENLFNKDKKTFEINLEDEIISKTILK